MDEYLKITSRANPSTIHFYDEASIVKTTSNRPFHGLTFDKDQLTNIHRHKDYWKERIKMSKLAKCECDVSDRSARRYSSANARNFTDVCMMGITKLPPAYIRGSF